MHLYHIPIQLINNVIDNYHYARVDFIGFTLSIQGILHFLQSGALALVILILYYLLGGKIRKLFFRDVRAYSSFINIAVGLIAVNIGLAILGVFSLLRPDIIAGYLITSALIALYPLSILRVRQFHNTLPLSLLNLYLNPWKNRIVWGAALFVLIALLRLAVPETAEDAYHTDLPVRYLAAHTTMLADRDVLHVIPYPQLAEMTYLIPIFFGDKEAARFIHFGLYLLILLLLCQIAKKSEYRYAKFAPLLFVTTPLVVRYSSSEYVDLFMVFTFLLSVLMLGKNVSKKHIILSGILFGAVISTKVWMLVYMPALLVYMLVLDRQYGIYQKSKRLLLFMISSFAIVSIWYIRAFLITGDPVFPIFAKLAYIGAVPSQKPSLFNYFGFNWEMFTPPNLFILSPFFFMGIVLCLLNFKMVYRLVRRTSLFPFFIILTCEQLIIQVHGGRYLLGWYAFAILIVSAGIPMLTEKLRIVRFIFIASYVLLTTYYLLSTLLILPYGLGWADQNKYLTRVLRRDNSSYYDFDHLFHKWNCQENKVTLRATYKAEWAQYTLYAINK